MSGSGERGVVTIGWVYGSGEAAMAMSLLDAAGIVSTPQSRQMMAVCWHYGQALGGVALSVPASQAEEALAILADPAPDERPTRRGWRSVVLFLLLFFCAGVPAPPSGMFLRRPTALAGAGQPGSAGAG